MKVHEIITESTILNEQLRGAIQAIELALSRGGIAAVEQELIAFGRILAGKSGKTVVDELAEAWVKTAELSGMSAENAITLGSNSARTGGVSAAVIADAEKAALALAKKRGVGVITVGDKVAAAKAWFGTGLGTVNQILTAWSIGQPVMECVGFITEAYKKHDAGDPEYQGAKLQYVVQFEITKCLQSVLAIWAGNKIIKGVMGPNGIQRLPFQGGPNISQLYNGLGEAGKAAFMVWMQTDEGKTAFAQWLLGNTMLPGGRAFAWVTEALGGWVKTGYDKILKQLGSDKAGEPPVSKPIEAKPRPQTRYDLSTGRALN